MRVACYIDGFNLYHAIDALDDDSLKWSDLYSLANSYLRDGDELDKVRFFTALNTWDAAKRARHVNYVNALEHTGVKVERSKFDKPDKYCHRHNRYCPIREEKQTDVAIGTQVLADCIEHGIRKILLVTADSDQIPTVKHVKRLFSDAKVIMIAPPKRLKVARELGASCDGIFELTAGRLRQHQMPVELRHKGRLVAARPALYGDRHAG